MAVVGDKSMAPIITTVLAQDNAHSAGRPNRPFTLQSGMENKRALKIGLPRLLILGCGDVGMRLLPLLRQRFRVFAVTSQPARCALLRAAGAVPIVADLDRPATLARLAGLAPYIVHLAPPASDGLLDRRTRRLCAVLPARARLVYVSTSGVYGDCQGALIDETRTPAPQNARAHRRVDAERVLRGWARANRADLAILRVPGIYAADRLPLKRLEQGTPALQAADDVHTNHIHADDLAQIIVRALQRGLTGRIYHAVDDSGLKMADYFDAVADTFDLPRPPRLPRDALRTVVSPMLLSFMSESRRMSNGRIKTELGVRLRYARVGDALAALRPGKR
jgi:nucleoside-diphosphate-sugar epimerase